VKRESTLHCPVEREPIVENNLDANGLFKKDRTTFSTIQKSEKLHPGEDKPDSLAEWGLSWFYRCASVYAGRHN
jgi:hypothetical protein